MCNPLLNCPPPAAHPLYTQTMDTSDKPQAHGKPGGWVLWIPLAAMIAAVIATLALFDWSGNNRPMEWRIFIPSILGVAGSVGALLSTKRDLNLRVAWALISAPFGIALVPLLLLATLYIAGP